MKYLREFTNHAAYEAFTGTSEFVLPNVSLCDQENELHFNPNSGPTPGGDYVEIGGVKWATMNIGATSPSEVGLYFQWGDTSGYTASQVGTDKMFNWAIYKYCSGAGTSSSAMTKYNSTDGKTVLEASDDAAQANLGGGWRMPTTTEWQTLGNVVNANWTNDYEGSGVAGLVCTDKTDSSKVLFFPAAGYCMNGSIYLSTYAYLWSSTLYSASQTNAYCAMFYGSTKTWNEYNTRMLGMPVRAVMDV